MTQLSQYTVYNASAGSGKTYTLVRDFLSILLQKTDPFYFRHVLAITFTNKASMEMKQRVLESLQHFALGESFDMKNDLQSILGMSEEILQNRSKAILEAILQNYSDLNITTIDSFTHRIIRSFTFDFGLTSDFEVELDSDKLLQEAVDVVISQIGVDANLTKVLVNFSIEKSDDDKAWDISKSLFDFAKILFNETDKTEFRTLLDKNFEDYEKLKQKLIPIIQKMEERMQKIGNRGLNLIAENGLQANDFYYSMLPKHFEKLSQDWEQAKFFDGSTLRNRIEEGVFYAKTKPQHVKTQIDNLLPELLELYLESEKLFSQLKLYRFWYESLFPMTLLNYIYKALEQLKKEYNIQLISDFNEMIQLKIKDEPTPFIYERLGEKFRHYFIDEMQDTSVLQWNNLISLIDNAISQEGSLLLVGDAKQSIYRWRGSNPEQFIELSNPDSNKPFQVSKKVVSLDTNFRSFSEVIDFNNVFFSHISGLLQNDTYKSLYQNDTFQKQNAQKGGYVQLEFLIKDKEDDEKDLMYPKKVLEIIKNMDEGFQWKDVCVLVRKNSQGSSVAQYLTENGIDILSSENLLLIQNERVIFLTDVLQMLLHPLDKSIRFNVLYFLWQHLKINLPKHDFFKQFIDLKPSDFYAKLRSYNIDIQENTFYQKSLYDGMEYLIRAFKLNEKSDVYIQFLLEFVLDFQNRNGSDLSGFLSHWEQKKETLSISVPEGKNAVQIMSIHKAKGLQFPVVIFPYDLNLYDTKNEKVWYHFDKDETQEGFEKLLINFKEELKYTDDEGFRLHSDFRMKQELDNYNLLYVALTRAVEQLYILTDYGLDSKKEVRNKFYSGLFTGFLKAKHLWNDEQLVYSFGEKSKILSDTKQKKSILNQPESVVYKDFISTDASSHHLVYHTLSSQLWNTEQGKAIDFGNLIHEILSQIITADDLENVLKTYLEQGILTASESEEIKPKLQEILSHFQLQKYFEQNFKVLCEREIYTLDGRIYIPDRVVFFNEKEAGILDYKTGFPLPEHHEQIDAYVKLLTEMKFVVKEKFLVYIGETLKVI